MQWNNCMYFISWESEIHKSISNVFIFNFPLYRTMFLTGTLQIIYFHQCSLESFLCEDLKIIWFVLKGAYVYIRPYIQSIHYKVSQTLKCLADFVFELLMSWASS